MKIIECSQGSEEWFNARVGVITASQFKHTREAARLKSGPNKGDYNQKAQDYAFRLAVERISGTLLDEGFTTWAMKRGHELEPEARMAHELETGLVVEAAGFVMTDDGLFGASADGLIGDDGGSEYKCLVSPEGLRDVLLNDDISEFTDQIQGCMWITGRQWWHFGLYCPALRPIGKHFHMKVVKRDDNYINDLESDLIKFSRLVREYEGKLRRMSANAEPMALAA